MRRFPSPFLSWLLASVGLASVHPTVRGASAPKAGDAGDSAPVVMSRKGADRVPWSNVAELEKFAAAGNARACVQLGEMCLRGDSVPKNIPRALALLEQAARGGEASAAFRLGMLYDDGTEGVPQDRARGLSYFRAAAAGGAAEAFHNLGAAYASGRGVPRDYAEALAWLILAREHGADSADAEKKVRERIQLHARPDWIVAGERRAGELQRELAAKPMAQWLGTPLGPGATPFSPAKSGSPQASVASAASNASKGAPLATPLDIKTRELPANWANHATTGEAAADDLSGPPVRRVTPSNRRLEWPSVGTLQRAARSGDPAAQYVLGQMMVEGDQVPEDTMGGVVMLERAVGGGDTDAAQKLAELYHGNGKVLRDDQKVFVYTLQAAKGGSPSAMFNVGSLYTSGEGVATDYVESLAWFIVARQHRYDRGGEKRIRDYLTKTAPAQVAAAEKRAKEIEASLRR